MKQSPPNTPQEETEKHPNMSGADLGLNFIISILICAAGGYGLDNLLNTPPLFMLLGFFLGFAAGMYVIWQKIKHL